MSHHKVINVVFVTTLLYGFIYSTENPILLHWYSCISQINYSDNVRYVITRSPIQLHFLKKKKKNLFFIVLPRRYMSQHTFQSPLGMSCLISLNLSATVATIVKKAKSGRSNLWLHKSKFLVVSSRMAVDGGHGSIGSDWDGRWNHVKKFLERTGPFTHPDFEPSTEVTHSWTRNIYFNELVRLKDRNILLYTVRLQ